MVFEPYISRGSRCACVGAVALLRRGSISSRMRANPYTDTPVFSECPEVNACQALSALLTLERGKRIPTGGNNNINSYINGNNNDNSLIAAPIVNL